ncbi:hypothetical protein [Flavobacterium sp. LC2016-01]|uniref:hypothetical protein n=1 Tax=Flavobacterium sp. LC2016-01 TaxID=2675876 RepID=UPI0012BB0208|nr:hypothetical protein [Flavobacterium sp. LC2016-01]MTH15547.1 hypothetical protein [Flavobacterium sp. LC2016-01]
MKPNLFFNQIKAIIPDLNSEWKEKYALFLADENLNLFSENLISFHSQKSDIIRMPYFQEEIIVSLQDAVSHFESVLKDFENNSDQLKSNLIHSLENVPFEIILLILGQRLTSASRRDETGIPPLREILLESCFKPFNKEISIAVRAWEKHVGRKKDSIFGEIKGNAIQKKENVEKLIHYIINHKTWWNIFYHYKHGLVYEVRVQNGQGLRWSADGKQFIGFLEDFLEE